MRCLSRTTTRMSIEKLYYHRAVSDPGCTRPEPHPGALHALQGTTQGTWAGALFRVSQGRQGTGTTQGRAGQVGQAGLQTRQLYPSRSSVLVSPMSHHPSLVLQLLHRDHCLCTGCTTSCTPSIYYLSSPHYLVPPHPPHSPYSTLDSYLAPPYSFSLLYHLLSSSKRSTLNC